MLPGSYYVVITPEVERDGIQARCLGLELRDSLAIFMPGLVAHALLLRAPLSEKTVATQVLVTGTGCINIDGCRVGTSKRVPGGISRTAGTSLSGSVDGSLRRETGAEGGHNPNLGRWPTNVVLVHGPGCQRDGTRKVRGNPTSQVFRDAYGGEASTTFLRGWSHPGNQHSDSDGTEMVDIWECQPDCPVGLLDGQSGIRPVSGTAQADKTHQNYGFTGYHGGGQGLQSKLPNDIGGASRYFPQFESLGDAVIWLNRLIGLPV